MKRARRVARQQPGAAKPDLPAKAKKKTAKRKAKKKKKTKAK